MLSALLHPEPLLLRSAASHIPAHHLLILGLPFASSKHHCPDNNLWSDRLTPNTLAERSLLNHVPYRLMCLERRWLCCGPFSVPGCSLSRMEPKTGTAKARTNDLNYFIEALARGSLQIHPTPQKRRHWGTHVEGGERSIAAYTEHSQYESPTHIHHIA